MSGSGKTAPRAEILVALLCFGHLAADIVQGALPALLPFLKDRYSLSYAASGAILMAAHITSSGIQPFFGYLTDRRPLPALMPLGCAVSGLGIALLPFAPNLWSLVTAVLVLGLGTAAFHPEGFKSTASVVLERRATGMSFFAVGGNMGFAIGAPAAIFLVTRFGLPGIIGLALPCALATALFLWALPALARRVAAARGASREGVAARRPALALAMIVVIVIFRSWTQLGLSTYIPFLYRAELDRNPGFVATMLFLFLGAGAVGTLFGGPIADRVGHRRMLFWSLALQVPLIAGFLWARGWLALAFACAVGATIVSTFSVTIVMAQELFPRRMATASGLIAGFAIGTGGIGVTLLGAVADRQGLPAATHLINLLPAVGACLALFLPMPWKPAR